MQDTIERLQFQILIGILKAKFRCLIPDGIGKFQILIGILKAPIP